MKMYSVIRMTAVVSFLSFVSLFSAEAQQGNQEQPDIYEQAEQEADRLQRILKLEDWQVFYVDSTLKHDFPAMMAEYENLRASKVENASMYQQIHDKWMDQIDVTYKRIFTESQWKAYLKSGAARQQKAREKRRQKAMGE
ncbi:MAG: hypothetical protein E7118_03210 [Bacteroidales bacterium]|nr:hypothetical protein [Bacteroidales bacterium]